MPPPCPRSSPCTFAGLTQTPGVCFFSLLFLNSKGWQPRGSLYFMGVSDTIPILDPLFWPFGHDYRQYQYMTCPSKCLPCCRPQGFRHISLDTSYNPITQAASFLLHGSPQCRSSAFGGYKDKHQQVPSSPNPWRVPVGSLPPTHHPTTTSHSRLFSLTLGAGVMGF